MPKQNLSFLDNLGSSDKGDAVQLTATQKVLVDIAAQFALDVRENLGKVDSNASGYLSDSTVPREPVVNLKSISIEIETAPYYDYVNKGVKGWQDKKGSGSSYQFRKPGKRGKKGSGPKSSKMVTAIRKWLIKEGLKTRDKSKNIKKHPISERERKRGKKTFTDTSTQTAIVIAANIRRRGLRKTGFWDDAVNKLERTIDEKIGEAVVIDILNSF